MNKILTIGVPALLVVVAATFSFVSFSHQSTPLSTQEEAIQAVIEVHPELAAYQTTSLPPSSVEVKQAPKGWYVGFIQKGSGVPGILKATCYLATDTKDISLVGTYSGESGKTAESITLETCEPVFAQTPTPPAPTTEVHAYGDVTLKLGQRAVFKNISILPLTIEEDSRCPVDVQCIQAGTVRVKVQIVSAMGTSTSILKLAQAFTTEGETITLTGATPVKNSKVTVTPTDYRLTFNVVPQKTAVTPPKGKCYIGGCSAQLCTDQPDAVSTCEYTATYACYQSAKCERQPNNQCGWTPTAELTACLAAPPQVF